MRKTGFIALLIVSFMGMARAQDDARAIVAKAVAAQGGEEKLAKIRAGRSKLKGTLFADGREIAFTGEEMFQLPGQVKIVLNLKNTPAGQTVVEVIDGDKGWISINGKATEADADALARMKQQVYLSRVIWLTPLLKDKEFELTTLKETKVNDKPALAVKVASKGQKEVSLYFDKESGLLVKLDYPTKNNLGRDVTQEDNFSNYAEVGGVKLPKKSVAFQDGKKLMELEVTEAQFPDSIPAREFAKP
jgi:hypothetical protein